MKKKRKSSGIIIIGNEILSGKTLDTNSNFMCNELFNKGISCDEVNITRDEELRIIEKIDLFKSKYDYVFTSGGIGPTHDDITSKSVAKAFGQKLVLNKKAKELLQKHYLDDDLTKARMKMAYLPENAIIIDNPISIAPGFKVENVFVFPGVPKILEIMFKEVINSLSGGKKYFKKTVTTILSEGLIGDDIEKIQRKHDIVEIGSYPYFKRNSFGVSLVISGDNKKKVLDVTSEVYNYIKLKNGNPKIF